MGELILRFLRVESALTCFVLWKMFHVIITLLWTQTELCPGLLGKHQTRAKPVAQQSPYAPTVQETKTGNQSPVLLPKNCFFFILSWNTTSRKPGAMRVDPTRLGGLSFSTKCGDSAVLLHPLSATRSPSCMAPPHHASPSSDPLKCVMGIVPCSSIFFELY